MEYLDSISIPQLLNINAVSIDMAREEKEAINKARNNAKL